MNACQLTHTLNALSPHALLAVPSPHRRTPRLLPAADSDIYPSFREAISFCTTSILIIKFGG
jgi:hypothetical protein